ncbi:hypothetical protein EHR01_16870 [Leptospira mtsangambouensis]|uniref:Lipoprotein n=1 Tax=Leptospira mtsangambouensis TaxID=2484912 RepID=A0ABY2NWF9_9LEPT|nr:hypothetical protein [Leptospira mtsangambouensis]TGM72897.1 hypothetical protein EHR01_16870 [Leptospira mtsangambouensis]
MHLVLPKVSHFDIGFIFGITMLACTMASVTVVWPLLFIPMLTVHSWLFGYEHLWSTYTRLLFHTEDRNRYKALIWIVPPIVFFVLLTIGKTWGLKGIYLTYFIGQFFHTVRQSWGITQAYRRQAGGMSWDSERLSEWTIWSIPIWGFLHRSAQRPNEFLFQEFWLPPVPWFVVHLVGIITITLWLYWAYTRLIAFRRNELALGHTLFMISHLIVFYLGYIWIEELCSGWLLVNVWHNVQYIAYVWIYNQKRFVIGIDTNAKVLSWLSQRGLGHTILYFIFTIALALPMYYLLPEIGFTLDGFFQNQLVPMAVVLVMSFTFHHYIVDGVIWKRRHLQTISHYAQ